LINLKNRFAVFPTSKACRLRYKREISYAIELSRFAAYAAFAASSKMLKHF